MIQTNLSRPMTTFFKSPLMLFAGLFFLLFANKARAQYVPVLDSLQTIIRKEVSSGTNHFLSQAKAYDSIAQLSNDTLRMGKGKNFMGMYYYFTGNHRQAVEYYLHSPISPRSTILFLSA